MKTLKILLVFLIVIIFMSLSLGCFQRTNQTEKDAIIVETEEENTAIETITETTTETSIETVTETVTETETETITETSIETETAISSTKTNLTQEEAINIAMDVAEGDVDRIETEIEEGKLVWKIRIVSNGTRTDIRIEDATGKVIKTDTNDN
jgi:uncharacterized membrane protein YkoI